MYISKLAVVNFRSCQNIVLQLNENEPNTFIGGNDCGKTAILKAIGLLLDSKTRINIKGDGQLTSDISNTLLDEKDYIEIFSTLNLPIFGLKPSSAIIIGEFILEKGDLDDPFFIQTTNHLKWSIENLKYNKVYILKYFDNDNPNGKYYLYCKEVEKDNLRLWSQNQTTLKDQLEKLNITDKEIKNENNDGRFTNLEKIRAIYNKLPTVTTWTEYMDFKKDRDFFPIYRYIDWNPSLDQLEEIAKDAMTSKISNYKNKLIETATQYSTELTKEVNENLKQMSTTMSTDIPNITAIKASVNFDINERVSDLVINKKTNDGDIRIESQGEGIKKQIWLTLLKWTSQQNIPVGETRKRFIWCFDEPEIHLYPSAQRDLFHAIKILSESAFQIFISTHSTIFVDRMNIKSIKQTNLNNGYSEVSQCSSVDDIHNSLGMKNSDFLFFDKFLAYEGDTEEVLIPHFYYLYFGKTIQIDNIQTVNLGGKDNYKHNKLIFENLLRDFKKTSNTVYYLLDGDSGLDEPNVILAGKYDIEDSLSNDIWIQVVKNYTELDIDETLINELRSNMRNERDKKFYKLLCDKIFNISGGTKILPTKGKVLSNLLKSIILSKDQIPGEIVTLFDKMAVLT